MHNFPECPEMASGDDPPTLIDTVVTCEGNLHDPDFSSRFQILLSNLKNILREDKFVEVRKIEPWNSVRVTISIPKEAAQKLRCLAQQGSHLLKSLGILTVQVEGDQVISLTLAGQNNDPTEVILKPSDGSLSSIPPFPSTSIGQNAPLAVLSPSPASSAFSRTPNVVAPSGDPLPILPPKPAATATRPTSLGGPFPFASMAHAAQTMQRTDSALPVNASNNTSLIVANSNVNHAVNSTNLPSVPSPSVTLGNATVVNNMVSTSISPVTTPSLMQLSQQQPPPASLNVKSDPLGRIILQPANSSSSGGSSQISSPQSQSLQLQIVNAPPPYPGVNITRCSEPSSNSIVNVSDSSGITLITSGSVNHHHQILNSSSNLNVSNKTIVSAVPSQSVTVVGASVSSVSSGNVALVRSASSPAISSQQPLIISDSLLQQQQQQPMTSPLLVNLLQNDAVVISQSSPVPTTGTAGVNTALNQQQSPQAGVVNIMLPPGTLDQQKRYILHQHLQQRKAKRGLSLDGASHAESVKPIGDIVRPSSAGNVDRTSPSLIPLSSSAFDSGSLTQITLPSSPSDPRITMSVPISVGQPRPSSELNTTATIIQGRTIIHQGNVRVFNPGQIRAIRLTQANSSNASTIHVIQGKPLVTVPSSQGDTPAVPSGPQPQLASTVDGASAALPQQQIAVSSTISNSSGSVFSVQPQSKETSGIVAPAGSDQPCTLENMNPALTLPKPTLVNSSLAPPTLDNVDAVQQAAISFPSDADRNKYSTQERQPPVQSQPVVEAKSISSQHQRPKPKEANSHLHLTSTGKPRQMLINPLTGHLEPMPSESSSESDDDDLRKPAKQKSTSKTVSVPHRQIVTTTTTGVTVARVVKSDILKPGSDDLSSRKFSQGRVTVVPVSISSSATTSVTASRKSREEMGAAAILTKDKEPSAPSVKGQPGEKIKLRLKLEKSEPISPAYKVDVSFVKKGEKSSKDSSSGVTSVSTSGSAYGGATNFSVPLPNPASAEQQPRVPPLHISLRGKNAAVVVNSPRRDEETSMSPITFPDKSNAIVNKVSKRAKSKLKSEISDGKLGTKSSRPKVSKELVVPHGAIEGKSHPPSTKSEDPSVVPPLLTVTSSTSFTSSETRNDLTVSGTNVTTSLTIPSPTGNTKDLNTSDKRQASESEEKSETNENSSADSSLLFQHLSKKEFPVVSTLASVATTTVAFSTESSKVTTDVITTSAAVTATPSVSVSPKTSKDVPESISISRALSSNTSSITTTSPSSSTGITPSSPIPQKISPADLLKKTNPFPNLTSLPAIRPINIPKMCRENVPKELDLPSGSSQVEPSSSGAEVKKASTTPTSKSPKPLPDLLALPQMRTLESTSLPISTGKLSVLPSTTTSTSTIAQPKPITSDSCTISESVSSGVIKVPGSPDGVVKGVPNAIPIFATKVDKVGCYPITPNKIKTSPPTPILRPKVQAHRVSIGTSIDADFPNTSPSLRELLEKEKEKNVNLSKELSNTNPPLEIVKDSGQVDLKLPPKPEKTKSEGVVVPKGKPDTPIEDKSSEEINQSQMSTGIVATKTDEQTGTHGEDSGIDSMDALSEKSPNQGESPARKEIDQTIDSSVVVNCVPSSEQSTVNSKALVKVVNDHLSKDKVEPDVKKSVTLPGGSVPSNPSSSVPGSVNVETPVTVSITTTDKTDSTLTGNEEPVKSIQEVPAKHDETKPDVSLEQSECIAEVVQKANDESTQKCKPTNELCKENPCLLETENKTMEVEERFVKGDTVIGSNPEQCVDVQLKKSEDTKVEPKSLSMEFPDYSTADSLNHVDAIQELNALQRKTSDDENKSAQLLATKETSAKVRRAKLENIVAAIGTKNIERQQATLGNIDAQNSGDIKIGSKSTTSSAKSDVHDSGAEMKVSSMENKIEHINSQLLKSDSLAPVDGIIKTVTAPLPHVRPAFFKSDKFQSVITPEQAVIAASTVSVDSPRISKSNELSKLPVITDGGINKLGALNPVVNKLESEQQPQSVKAGSTTDLIAVTPTNHPNTPHCMASSTCVVDSPISVLPKIDTNLASSSGEVDDKRNIGIKPVPLRDPDCVNKPVSSKDHVISSEETSDPVKVTVSDIVATGNGGNMGCNTPKNEPQGQVCNESKSETLGKTKNIPLETSFEQDNAKWQPSEVLSKNESSVSKVESNVTLSLSESKISPNLLTKSQISTVTSTTPYMSQLPETKPLLTSVTTKRDDAVQVQCVNPKSSVTQNPIPSTKPLQSVKSSSETSAVSAATSSTAEVHNPAIPENSPKPSTQPVSSSSAGPISVSAASSTPPATLVCTVSHSVVSSATTLVSTPTTVSSAPTVINSTISTLSTVSDCVRPTGTSSPLVVPANATRSNALTLTTQGSISSVTSQESITLTVPSSLSAPVPASLVVSSLPNALPQITISTLTTQSNQSKAVTNVLSVSKPVLSPSSGTKSTVPTSVNISHSSPTVGVSLSQPTSTSAGQTVFAIHQNLGQIQSGQPSIAVLPGGQKIVPLKLVTIPRQTSGQFQTIPLTGIAQNRASPTLIEAVNIVAGSRSNSPKTILSNQLQTAGGSINLSSVSLPGGNIHLVPISMSSGVAGSPSNVKVLVSQPIKVQPSLHQPMMMKSVLMSQQAATLRVVKSDSVPNLIVANDNSTSVSQEEPKVKDAKIESQVVSQSTEKPLEQVTLSTAKSEKERKPASTNQATSAPKPTFKHVAELEVIDSTFSQSEEDFPFEAEIIHDEKDLEDVLASESLEVQENGIDGIHSNYDFTLTNKHEKRESSGKVTPSARKQTSSVDSRTKISEGESSHPATLKPASPLYSYAGSKSRRCNSRSPSPAESDVHGEDQEIINSFRDASPHSESTARVEKSTKGKLNQPLTIEIPSTDVMIPSPSSHNQTERKSTRNTRSNTRLVSPDITAFRSDTPKPSKFASKPDSITLKNSPKPSPTGSIKMLSPNVSGLTITPSSSNRSSPLLTPSSSVNHANIVTVDKIQSAVNSVYGSKGLKLATLNKRKRQESDSSSASKDENSDDKSEVDLNSRPGKRRCSENAAELIKACIGVEDTPKRNIMLTKRTEDLKKESKLKKSMATVPEEQEEDDSIDSLILKKGRTSRASSEDRSSSRGSSVQRSLGTPKPKDKDEDQLKEQKSSKIVNKQVKVVKRSPNNQNSTLKKDGIKTTSVKKVIRGGVIKNKSPLTPKTRTNVRKDLKGSDKFVTTGSHAGSLTPVSQETENLRRKTRSSAAVEPSDPDSVALKRRRISKDSKS